jgi:hypothetical protein
LLFFIQSKTAESAPLAKKSRKYEGPATSADISVSKVELIASINKKQGKKVCTDIKPMEASVATRRSKSTAVISVPPSKEIDSTLLPSKQMHIGTGKEGEELLSQSLLTSPEPLKVADDSCRSEACVELTADAKRTVDATGKTDLVSLELSNEASASIQTFYGESLTAVVGDTEDLAKQEPAAESILCQEITWDSGAHTLDSLPSACSSYQSAASLSDESQIACLDEISQCKSLSQHCESIDSVCGSSSDYSCTQSCKALSEHLIEYPSLSQNDFLAIFGLINRSELPPPSLATANRLHREVGGTLRRSIKSNRVPHMIYRRMNFSRDHHTNNANLNCLTATLSRNAGYDKDEIQKDLPVKKVPGGNKKFIPFTARKGKTCKDGSDTKANSITNSLAEAADGLQNVDNMEMHDLSMLADAALAGGAINKVTAAEPLAAESSSPSKTDFKKPKVIFGLTLLVLMWFVHLKLFLVIYLIIICMKLKGLQIIEILFSDVIVFRTTFSKRSTDECSCLRDLPILSSLFSCL